MVPTYTEFQTADAQCYGKSIRTAWECPSMWVISLTQGIAPAMKRRKALSWLEVARSLLLVRQLRAFSSKGARYESSAPQDISPSGDSGCGCGPCSGWLGRGLGKPADHTRGLGHAHP